MDRWAVKVTHTDTATCLIILYTMTAKIIRRIITDTIYSDKTHVMYSLVIQCYIVQVTEKCLKL